MLDRAWHVKKFNFNIPIIRGQKISINTKNNQRKITTNDNIFIKNMVNH
jgi:hypothetical protein